MLKLTPVQKRTLATAVRDGEIRIGGIDKTPNVRIDVVMKLQALGLLKVWAWHWRPTDEGKALCSADKKNST